MGVALAGTRQAPAFQEALAGRRTGRRLEAAEILVVDLAAEAAGIGRIAGYQRIGRLFEKLDRLVEQLSELHDLGNKLVWEAMRFHAQPRGLLDEFGHGGERLRTKLTRFTLQRVG